MREIKFRAWDTTKQMMSGWPIAIVLARKHERKDKLPYVLHKDAQKAEWVGAPTSRYVLMQYTGLKDKNGKEIYEKDILTHSIIRIGKNPKKFVGVVEYHENQFLNCNFVNEEIIGNIYENPELLTPTNPL